MAPAAIEAICNRTFSENDDIFANNVAFQTPMGDVLEGKDAVLERLTNRGGGKGSGGGKGGKGDSTWSAFEQQEDEEWGNYWVRSNEGGMSQQVYLNADEQISYLVLTRN